MNRKGFEFKNVFLPIKTKTSSLIVLVTSKYLDQFESRESTLTCIVVELTGIVIAIVTWLNMFGNACLSERS